jgi:metal-dependent HD superfamily phosphatase/phosphodiesterase
MGGSRNSGSHKRKSTDDGLDMSKGRKIQQQISEKSKGIHALAGIGEQLVKLREQLIDEVGHANKVIR